ncbi:MAG: peptide chain release factor N(5)-glutamine methyltransferase [Acidimicrobiales bacterium]
MTWRHLYLEALERLADRQAARWFVEEASGGAWPVVLDEPAPARAEGVFRSMLARRAAGEPVQYVLGHWAFRRLDLMVDGRVLIPRPETEVVVEVALGELARLAGHPLVVDLGTGSGAIALSIVTECAGAEVWATDLSEDALAVASANLTGLGTKAAGRARLVQGSWWHALPAGLKGTLDLAVTNPPYISESELASLPGEVSGWEPLQALVAGPSGLEALKVITAEAPAWLGARAALVAEIASHQDRAAVHLAYSAGFEEVFVKPDLTGRPRVLVARRGT